MILLVGSLCKDENLEGIPISEGAVEGKALLNLRRSSSKLPGGGAGGPAGGALTANKMHASVSKKRYKHHTHHPLPVAEQEC